MGQFESCHWPRGGENEARYFLATVVRVEGKGLVGALWWSRMVSGGLEAASLPCWAGAVAPGPDFSGVWCGARCPLVSLGREFPQLGGESPWGCPIMSSPGVQCGLFVCVEGASLEANSGRNPCCLCKSCWKNQTHWSC